MKDILYFIIHIFTVGFDQFNANIHIDYTLEKVHCVFKCVMYFFQFF